MGPDQKVLDDIARVAGGAVNIMSGLQQQIREEIRSKVEETASRMDLVSRDELDEAQAIIKKLCETQAELEKRIEILEKK